MKKTKQWQVPEVYFNTIQDKHANDSQIIFENLTHTKRRKLVRLNEQPHTVPYLLQKNG
mgnify:CR=1 FL=1